MTLLAVPNVSEGRNEAIIDSLVASVLETGTRVLDLHSDPAHNRSVITATERGDRLVDAMASLATRAASLIDLRMHQGVHPRLGVLDVCPIVPHDTSMKEAVRTAHQAGRAILKQAGIPVYFYGHAARRAETRHLPDIRRNLRTSGDLAPDLGNGEPDPRSGIACVGARPPLIAFNVWLTCDVATARTIARRVRTDAVRALGLAIDDSISQVSMNLTSPDETGIAGAFESVERVAREFDADVRATEIVGLVPKRYLPDPYDKSARLLMKPGRSLESVLASTS
ncbi:MAG: glutamate formimidoyltransferase [Actinomycetota bacterium]